jgi:sugar lactone lactonase YvrE
VVGGPLAVNLCQNTDSGDLQPYLESHCNLGEGPHYVPERHELRFLDINAHKLLIVDLKKGPSSTRTIETGTPIGVTADLADIDSSETILAGVKDGVTKFNLKTGEHEYVAKYWTGSVDAQDKTRRCENSFLFLNAGLLHDGR